MAGMNFKQVSDQIHSALMLAKAFEGRHVVFAELAVDLKNISSDFKELAAQQQLADIQARKEEQARKEQEERLAWRSNFTG